MGVLTAVIEERLQTGAGYSTVQSRADDTRKQHCKIARLVVCADTHHRVMVESHGCVQTAKRRGCECHL